MENVTYFQYMGILYEMADESGELDAVLRGTTLEWNDARPVPSRADVDRWGEEAETRINLQRLRRVRNGLLFESDWTQNSDVPEETKTKWQSYRTALRDITETYTSLSDVRWPERPDGVDLNAMQQAQTGGAQSPQFTGGEVVQEDNPLFTPGT